METKRVNNNILCCLIFLRSRLQVYLNNYCPANCGQKAGTLLLISLIIS